MFLTDILDSLRQYATNLSQLSVKGWRPSENLPNTNLLNWLAGLRNCTIQNSEVSLGTKIITFQEKVNYAKWGNIDNPNSTFHITYGIQPILINNVSILGKRINDLNLEIPYYL